MTFTAFSASRRPRAGLALSACLLGVVSAWAGAALAATGEAAEQAAAASVPIVASASAPASAAAAATPSVDRPLPPGFILGADVSTLEQVERHGGRFSNEDGRPASALQILRVSGVDWVRLRLWHTPVNAEDVFEGDRRVSRRGDPVGGGDNDLARTIRLARRARGQGLKWLLDLHYSDFWVDPSRQDKPAAWASLHGAELEAAVQRYTREVLTALHQAGCDPDMVQVGNEINGGLLWPDGQNWQRTPGEKVGGDAGFTALLRAGIAGVRETDALRGGRLPVVLHLANGGDNALYRRSFDLFERARLDYDVIGLSWYVYFHGPLTGLRANLEDLASRYHRPMLVVETAYAWTLDNGDDAPNVLNAERVAASGYPASVSGQSALLHDLIQTVAAVPGGLGVMWWEPAWLPVPGVGWRTGDGNGWDNQTLFDTSGRALPTLGVFQQQRAIRPAPPASTPPSAP